MFYLSVVSHNHLNIINEINILKKLDKHNDIKIIILDNVEEQGLQEWCNCSGIDYIVNQEPKGFSANNNLIFNYIQDNFDLTEDDYFLILNPDVYITMEYMDMLIQKTTSLRPNAFTIDLFKDFNYQNRDPFIRKFPSLKDFISSFLFGVNNTIIQRDKNTIDNFDWCAGSFICFNIDSYKALKGFDEGYFMYCEDIDICYRAQQLNLKIDYFSDIKAVHLAQHSNRSIFSKHFIWHIKSIIRFLFKSKTPKLSSFMGLKNNSSIK
ncbi:glycosyltransferase family 2 protein [Pseudocolwellia sp. HL-MZ19]|uniref:glycosyltransferase family 2 protein n=1 Tax=Pseudocolwellia sp. HL-MZ19 TaxID=3400846 RepID=UPI003CF454FB